MSSTGEEPEKADGETFSAGEVGDASPRRGEPEDAEIIIGEIPDEDALSRMLWTARCTLHGSLGVVDSREEAELLRENHLRTHGEPPS